MGCFMSIPPVNKHQSFEEKKVKKSDNSPKTPPKSEVLAKVEKHASEKLGKDFKGDAENLMEAKVVSQKMTEAQKLREKYQHIFEHYHQDSIGRLSLKGSNEQAGITVDGLLRILVAAEGCFDTLAETHGKFISVDEVDYAVKFDGEAPTSRPSSPLLEKSKEAESVKKHKLHIIRLPKSLELRPSTPEEKAKEHIGKGLGGVISRVLYVSQGSMLPFKVGDIEQEVKMLQYVHRDGQKVGVQHAPITWVDITHNQKSIKAMLEPEEYKETLWDEVARDTFDVADNDNRILTCIQLLKRVREDFWDSGVFHGDIKPENIFVDKEGGVRVGDLGDAKKKSDDKKIFRFGTHTRAYCSRKDRKELEKAEKAGDVAAARHIAQQRDLFALGSVLSYVLIGLLPHEVDKDDYPVEEFDKDVLEGLKGRKYPEDLINLIKDMTELDPKKRISADEAISRMAAIEKSLEEDSTSTL